MTSHEENSPLLSIVIPTRNREEYAISAIISILNISAPDLELVVQDNSDSRDLEEYIRNNVDDTRLKYNYTSTPLSMIDNFNTAVDLASGKYLCIIGDDDGVNPEIIEATRWANRNGLDALKPIVSASYLWPKTAVSSTVFTKVLSNGTFAIKPFSGKITRPDPETEMRKIIRSGGCKYLQTDVPRLYHGIVKRECLNKVREQTGVFFGGLSPDIFADFGIANFSKNVVSIDYPLTIAGACKSSGSGESQRGEHVGNLEDAPHFRYRNAYQWSEIVPHFYSVQTIWADTMLTALKALGRDDLLRDFNLPFLCANCIVAHPKYRRIILCDMYRAFRVMNKNQLVGTFQFCYSLLLCWRHGRVLLIKLLPKRIKRILLVLLGITRINDVKDIVEATNTLTDYLRKNKKRFLDVVSQKSSFIWLQKDLTP